MLYNRYNLKKRSELQNIPDQFVRIKSSSQIYEIGHRVGFIF